MTLLYNGTQFQNGVATSWNRQAGYEPSNPALSLLVGGASPAPDGIDRLAFVPAPDGSGAQVLRTVLGINDPVGLFSASSRRSQVTYLIAGATAAFGSRLWYWFRYYLPADFPTPSESKTLALWQIHQTPDSTNQQNAFTVDTGADTLTFDPAIIWDDGQALRVDSTGTMPGGLPTGIYWVINPGASNTIQLASTIGGSAVNITSAGSGTLFADERTSIGPPIIADARGDRVLIRQDTQLKEMVGTKYEVVSSYPLRRGVVENFVVEATWDWQSGGSIQIWHNARKLLSLIGVGNCFDDSPIRGGNGNYPAQCIYCPDGWGVESNYLTAYFWDMMIGDSSYASFNEFMEACGSSQRELEGFVSRGIGI